MYAHSENALGEKHLLTRHLKSVAQKAAKFASKFQAASWGYLVGLLHDVGKFNSAFQEYLEHCQEHPERRIRGPDHSSAGAVLAMNRYWDYLGFVLAGHHGGLSSPVDLKGRLHKMSQDQVVQQVLTKASEQMSLPAPLSPPSLTSGKQTEFFLRILFSTLVDADFLDTETHFNPIQTELRQQPYELSTLAESLRRDQAQFNNEERSKINLLRHEIYRECLKAAEWKPGFFRLTVPTGGGKTRSGMAFALQHAVNYQKERVIVAIPYTSIIDQTAQVYRDIFRPENVLEHHSAVYPSDREDEFGFQQWAKLAAENWDAPIVVTTTVQLFESLFANRPSACRKLHNLVNSVVILDEVQTLPAGLLAPVLEVLQQLVDHYGASVVLCTATQPALADPQSPYLKGLRGPVKEIVPNPERYFQELKRVTYELPPEPWSWKRVAQEMADVPQCLAVVNTKKDALVLLEALNDPESLHLSTLLCMAHRREVIAEIKKRLDPNKPSPCRVVATQVVEAGVDLDFPVVFRSMGPLDRIVQAAGRCNREGRLAEGRAVIFQPADGRLPPGEYRAGSDIAAAMLKRPKSDLHSPVIFEEYFRQLYKAVPTDIHKINDLRDRLDFPEVAARFRLIADDTVPLVVTYPRTGSPAATLLARLTSPGIALGGEARLLLRRLQPYLVNVHGRLLEGYKRRGLVRELPLGLWEWIGNYHEVKGIQDQAIDPDLLVI
ncbi:MAG: CRISPR-associated helicase Cas3' [Deltaproteobacteria bacterium]|nr:CRISPR-associated helicase Cas3' [Deltaproteobacteria bacterium]